MSRALIAGRMPLTLVLIAICVALAGITSFGADRHLLHGLYISNYTWAGLREILHGQLWRLFTPIFIHFGIIPIVFYMLWLYDLGGMLERAQGTRRLLMLVLFCAATGNLGQFLWAGPDFGGMAGVLFGLLGYTWIQRRLDPQSGLELHNYLVAMMLAWFVSGWAGAIAEVSNMAQTMGLCVGLALGWWYSPNKHLVNQR